MLQKIVLYILAIVFFASCQSKQTAADLVILGGTIYTVNEKQPTVEAVAVQGDTIIFAGSEAEARKYIQDKTEVIDLQGKIMTPGLIEGHAHLMGVGYNELNLDLMNTKSFADIVHRVKEAVDKAQPGQWIIGRGWHQDKWDVKPDEMVKAFPTHKLLSAISPNNPVFLEHASGHMSLANNKAMELAGINLLSRERTRSSEVEGGEIIRDALGNPTGMFVENAVSIIQKYVPVSDSISDRQALELALQSCLRNGITSFHDAGASRENIALYRQFKKKGNLSVRLNVMLSGSDSKLIYEWLSKGPEVDADHQLTIRSIKLYSDGALGSRGAWLLEPYVDRHDFSGMATLSMDTVLKVSRVALQRGFQVCTHAIGDRANHEILNRYETAFKENPDKAKHARFRIEHAQHLHPNDIPRFGSLGVIPAMQAIHMSSDRPWAIDRLGEKRIKEGAYMWQSLLKSGAHIVNGTDAPVEPINPIPCFYASITRKTLKGEPEGGYEPKEKMTREQALRSYTLDAAYGAFEENIKGSIEVGKLADFTVFTKDIMKASEQEILTTEVSITIVGGKILYKK